jgi:methyl-accepting chemotaxis protein
LLPRGYSDERRLDFALVSSLSYDLDMSIRTRFAWAFFFGGTVAFAGCAVATAMICDTATIISTDPMALVYAAIAVFALVGAGALAVHRAQSRFSQDLGQILSGVRQIASGNLMAEFPQGGAAELRQVSEALRTMCGQTRMIMGQLGTLSERVLDATDGAGESIGEVSTGARLQVQNASRSFEALGRLRINLQDASLGIEVLARRLEENSSILSQMDGAIGRIASTIAGLTANIDQASQATREGDKHARQVSSDLSSLSTAMGTAHSTLHEMTDGAQEMRNHAKDTANVMGRLEAEAQRIGRAIEDVIAGSEAVHRSNERILEVTATLESRVDQVDQVIEVIRNLAERTKLLSINASIIASEAGEHGRAFAVVAREVKDLAQSTAGAIGEISTVVAGLKEGFAQTVITIQKGQRDVDEGSRMAQNAVELLRSIPDVVHKASARNAEIVGRAHRQAERGAQVEEIVGRVSLAIGQVNELLVQQISRNERTLALFGHIHALSDQVMGSAREHTTASSDVSHAMERISTDFKSVAQRVREEIKRLQDVVALSEQAVQTTDESQKRAERLSEVIEELHRYALFLGKDFRRLGQS